MPSLVDAMMGEPSFLRGRDQAGQAIATMHRGGSIRLGVASGAARTVRPKGTKPGRPYRRPDVYVQQLERS